MQRAYIDKDGQKWAEKSQIAACMDRLRQNYTYTKYRCSQPLSMLDQILHIQCHSTKNMMEFVIKLL